MLDDLIDLPPWDWPQDARNRLLAVLAKGTLPRRRLAAGLLTHVLDDAAAEALLARAQAADEDPELRAIALIAIGPGLEECDIDGFDDPYGEPPFSRRTFQRVGDALERLYREAAAPPSVRRAALETAVRAPREWQRAAIRASWSSGDEHWRRTAVFCMGFVPGFAREVGEALASADPELVRGVVRAAAHGLPDVAETAEPLLLSLARRSDDRELRLDAIGALAGISSEESRELLEELTNDADTEIVDSAFEALAMRGDVEGGDLDDDQVF